MELLIIRWIEDCGYLYRYMCICSILILCWLEWVKMLSYKYFDFRFFCCILLMYEVLVFNMVVLEISIVYFNVLFINCI